MAELKWNDWSTCSTDSNCQCFLRMQPNTANLCACTKLNSNACYLTKDQLFTLENQNSTSTILLIIIVAIIVIALITIIISICLIRKKHLLDKKLEQSKNQALATIPSESNQHIRSSSDTNPNKSRNTIKSQGIIFRGIDINKKNNPNYSLQNAGEHMQSSAETINKHNVQLFPSDPIKI